MNNILENTYIYIANLQNCTVEEIIFSMISHNCIPCLIATSRQG